MSCNLFPYKNLFPKVEESAFIAPGAKLIGDVQVGKNSSIWYNAVLRGDINYIKIGETSNIQDGTIIHVTHELPVIIGDKVTIGHQAVIHGCVINDLTLIGMGAIVLDYAVVEQKSLVAAGALVKQKFTVPSGTMVAGVPAKVIRELTEEEIKALEESAISYKIEAQDSKKSIIDFFDSKF
ncbi:MAG: gamma carbonic anhydrase family protein [Ignavibacteriales bacterium]|nr:gamma carbonic anhydrase family protein [Ignavibacteriales bacterium]